MKTWQIVLGGVVVVGGGVNEKEGMMTVMNFRDKEAMQKFVEKYATELKKFGFTK
jgi:hypothetical protein